ncbi:MAG: ParB-like nuclease domain-containing protein [Deltaproteobacteria bacterium]|nr:ParB-like nuclease domain-containing protein [Deltaproteobacteria bacterium]
MSDAHPFPDDVREPEAGLSADAPAVAPMEAPAAQAPVGEVPASVQAAEPPPEPPSNDTPLEPEKAVEEPKPTPARPPSKRVKMAAVRGPERPALIPPTSIAIDAIEPDDLFQLREVGDVAGLATSLARVGQLFPIDVRPRGGSFQVIAGFRRLAALKFLQRGSVLARVHVGLSDSDAWIFALAQALENRSLTPEEIDVARQKLEQNGQLTPMTRGLIDAAITVPGSDLEPEDPNASAAEEVDLDELAEDLEQRLVGISADLSLVTELWAQLDGPQRGALLEQLRYYGELHAYLSRLR